MPAQSSSSVPLPNWMRPHKQLEKIRLVQVDTFNDLETNSDVLPDHLLEGLHDRWREYQDDTAEFDGLSTLQLIMRNGTISSLKGDVKRLNQGTKRVSSDYRSKRLVNMLAIKRSSVETLDDLREVDPEATIFGSESPTPKITDIDHSGASERCDAEGPEDTFLLNPVDERERLTSLGLWPDVDIFRDSDEEIIQELSAQSL